MQSQAVTPLGGKRRDHGHKARLKPQQQQQQQQKRQNAKAANLIVSHVVCTGSRFDIEGQWSQGVALQASQADE